MPCSSSSSSSTTCVVLMLMLVGVFVCLSSVPVAMGQGFSRPPGAKINPVAFIQVAFNKVSKVDGVEQLFDADFYMQIFWCDLALQSWFVNNNTGPNVQNGIGLLPPVAAGNFEFTPYLNSWYDPDLEFVNGDGDIVEQGTYYTIAAPPFVTAKMYRDLGMDPAQNGTYIWTVKDFRYIGSFTTPLDLHSFPYDNQFVQLVIESQWADSSQLSLVYTDVSQRFLWKSVPDNVTSPIIGWDVVNITAFRTYHNYNLFPGGNYSRMVVAMELSRQPQYYEGKLVVGVVLLVLMCVCVYSLAVDEADRQMGTLQVFAGIVTFLFVASADVPKIPYLTRLDTFFLLSFGFTAFMLVTHAVLYFWRHDEGKEHDDEDEDGSGDSHSQLHADGETGTGTGHGKHDHDSTASKLTHITYGPMGSQADVTASGSTSANNTSSIRQRKSQTVPEDGANHAFIEMSPTPAFGDNTTATSPSAASGSGSTSPNPDTAAEQKQELDVNASSSAFHVTKPNLAKNGTGTSSKAGSFSKRRGGRGRRCCAAWRLASCWRRMDSIIVAGLFVAYAIAVAVILARPASTVDMLKRDYYDKMLSPWPHDIWTPSGIYDYTPLES